MTATTDTRADLVRCLGVWAEPPDPSHDGLAGLLGLPPVAASDWTDAFTVQLVPHASIYLNPDGMLGGEAADRIAGFWRALRMPAPSDPDHLASLLGLYATLIDAETGETDQPRRALYRQARTALLHEHLLAWLPAYTRAMEDVGPAGYRAWARLLRETLGREVSDVGAPDRLPAHLRDAAEQSAAGGGMDGVLDHLLSPLRSGMPLARGHAAALARASGLGFRMGDRRRMLRSVIEQDPPGVLGRLADLADTWADRHRADEALTGPAAAWWSTRAATTATLLRSGG